MEIMQKKSIGTIIVNVFFLIVLNMVLMAITGFLTLDSEANTNSRIGAYLLSFFIPFFIVLKTKKMSGLERMLKFGLGYILYIIMSLIIVGFAPTFLTGLTPCLVIALGTLNYGSEIIRIVE